MSRFFKRAFKIKTIGVIGRIIHDIPSNEYILRLDFGHARSEITKPLCCGVVVIPLNGVHTTKEVTINDV